MIIFTNKNIIILMIIFIFNKISRYSSSENNANISFGITHILKYFTCPFVIKIISIFAFV